MGRSHKHKSGEYIGQLKPVLMEDVRTLRDQEIYSKCHFEENLIKSMKKIKNLEEFSTVLATAPLTNFKNLVTHLAFSVLLDKITLVLVPGFMLSIL